jgi:hypothetical protein
MCWTDLEAMGRGRAAGAFIAVLISGALIDVARGGEGAYG